MPRHRYWNFLIAAAQLLMMLLALRVPVVAGQATRPDDMVLYRQLQGSSNFAKSSHLQNVVLQRDRVTITFKDGIIYFPLPIAGALRSAVFIGSGTIQATPPPIPFEQANVRRLLKADDLSTDFKTAVLRFTDDSGELLSKGVLEDVGTLQQSVELLAQFEPNLLKETGINISARQFESIVNGENPGIFLAQMDGGKRGRFTFAWDPQSRIPAGNFDINAGEKGLVWAYDETIESNDVWMAFYGTQDYSNTRERPRDSYDLVDTPNYSLTLDLMQPNKVLGLDAKLDLVARVSGARAISFVLGEDLPIDQNQRRDKQLHLLDAHLSNGSMVTFFQEPWEGGFTIVLPDALVKGQSLSLNLALKGDFMMESPDVAGTYFPRRTTSWYPRHGFLSRARFDISLIHRPKDHVVSIGDLVGEKPVQESKDSLLTEFRMDQPVGFASFAVGPYEVHKDTAKEQSGRALPIEFYSMPGNRGAIKEDFILAEMNNSIRFFSNLFGEYPYSVFRGAYHPFNFGQGFPTTIMIPAADRDNYHTHSFIAHETSHQWWGDMVSWRSYQDQWLSEGFADYSGMLYVQSRDKTASEKLLIEEARSALKAPPRKLNGIGPGRLTDVGPLIMGLRLDSRETFGAYTALTYSKGALVLRMIHMLFTDFQTGDGQAFFNLMSDFVSRHKGGTATTDDFFALANERIGSTQLARKYGYKDLSWFYKQWVTQTYLPSYELVYHFEDKPGGGVVLKGDLFQKGLPEGENWFMPVPLVLYFPGNQTAEGSVMVQGAQSPVSIDLPQKPEKVELDPELWVLSERTTTTKR